MLNLVQLKNEAISPDSTITTGFEAYMRQGKKNEPAFKRLGGSIVWRGDMLIGLIGPADEKWDICFIAEYPSFASFISMQRDGTYRKAVEHRQMALKTPDL